MKTLLLLALTAQQTPAVSDKEILSLLPPNLSLYLSAGDLRQGYAEAKKFVNRLAPGGKGALFDMAVAGIQVALGQLPRELREGIQDGMKRTVSVHLAILGDPDRSLLILRTEDGEFLEKFLYETLAPYTETTAEAGRYKAVRLKGTDGYAAAVGSLGFLASDLELLREVLVRKDGADQPGLRGTPLWERFAKPSPAGVTLRAYADLQAFLVREILPRGRGRWSQYFSDRLDAAFGLSGIRTLWLEATLAEGRFDARVEVEIDKTCGIYHGFWKQKEGPRDLLRYIPLDALMAAHANVEDAVALMERFRTLSDRFDQATIEPRNETAWDSFLKEFRRRVGVPLEECARAVGNEGAVFFAPKEIRSFETGEGLCLLGKVRDPEKLADLILRIRNSAALRNRTWRESSCAGRVVNVADGNPALAYALDGDVLILGVGEEGVRRALEARSKKNLADLKPETGSKAAYVNLKFFWKLLEESGEIPVPRAARWFSEDAYDLIVIRETEQGITCTSRNGMAGLVTILPVTHIASSARLDHLEEVVVIAAPAPKTSRVDVPKVELPADPGEAERRLARWIQALGADDVAQRDEATRRLLGVGARAIPSLATALQSAEDPEVRQRIEGLLLELKAYDAVPAIAERKVRDLVIEMQKRISAARSWASVPWEVETTDGFHPEPHSGWWQGLPELKDLDLEVLDSRQGLQAFARALGDERIDAKIRAQMTRVLFERDLSPCADELRRIARTGEPRLRAHVLLALGRQKDEATLSLIRESLRSKEKAMHRAAFLAVERSAERSWVPELFSLLDAEDSEVRFNAAYTLEKITRGAIRVNGLLPAEERAEQIRRARAQWESKPEK